MIVPPRSGGRIRAAEVPMGSEETPWKVIGSEEVPDRVMVTAPP
ncbi:hypothetical protein RKD27_004381 [Streptomyces sp. SAI-126]